MTKQYPAKQYLIEVISNREFAESVPPEIVIVMARQMLAGMEQEPVAYMHRNGVSLMWAGDLDAKFKVKQGGWSPLYAAPQLPQPASENIAMQNFRTAMEGIGHIRRTLEETFGGMHGTHVEPDALVECKAICDAICEAYRGTAPQVTSVPEEVPESLKDRLITICDLVEDNDEYCQDIWNACRATMLNGGKS